jgi:hypothetical protein
MKALALAVLVIVGSGSAALAQDAVVTHRVVRVHTVTHNDGRPHRRITRFRHRTVIRTPSGTMVKTTTRTTTTTPH